MLWGRESPRAFGFRAELGNTANNARTVVQHKVSVTGTSVRIRVQGAGLEVAREQNVLGTCVIARGGVDGVSATWMVNREKNGCLGVRAGMH